jgi:cytochrome c oxidase cbb3-type subunit 3
MTTTTPDALAPSNDAHAQGSHTYDGIEEHDNHLPRWWLMTRWAAILFGFGYWMFFHTFAIGELPRTAFNREWAARAAANAAAEERAGVVDDATLVALSKDPSVVASGRGVFMTSCLPCHGDKAQGIVGPNLTDNRWIHGGTPSQILASISDGWAVKGMPAWKPALGAARVRDAAAYVVSLKNTNVAGGKAPEGTEVP